MFFHCRQEGVSGVGARLTEEIVENLLDRRPAFERVPVKVSQVQHDGIVVIPYPVLPPKRGDTAFYTDARARESGAVT